MSEMDKIQKYLKKTFESFEANLNQPLISEYYQLAKTWADLSEIEDLQTLASLKEPFRRDRSSDRANDAYIDTLSLLIKAKQQFENGEIQNTIDLLFIYHLQLGRIQQNITEEDSFKAEASKKSKIAAYKQHEPDKLIKLEACRLLREHKPKDGWKNIPAAAKAILRDLKQFFEKNRSGSYLEINNLDRTLEKWMGGKSADVSSAFKETASLNWIKISNAAKERKP